MLLIWGPVLLIAYWGFAYLRACILALTSSESGVAYTLPTKGGPLLLRAESFQVDFRRNVVHLSRVAMRDPQGRLLASAGSAILQDAIPRSLSGFQKPIVATVWHAYGRVDRLPNGKLELEKFLPPSTTKASDVPFSVEVRDANILLEDYRGGKIWQSHAMVPSFKIEGIGKRWLGAGSAGIEHVGQVSAGIRNDPDHGLTIEARSPNANVAALLRHIVSGPDVERLPVLRSLSADSLRISGPFRVFVPKEGPISYEAKVVADAGNIAYGNEVRAQTAHFEGVLTHSGLRGVLTAQSSGIRARYSGALSWGRQTVLGGSLVGQIDKLQNAPGALQRFLPKGTTFSGGVFDGWVSYTGGGSLAVAGLASADQASYGTERLNRPRFNLVASSDRVALDLSSANWNGAPVHGALNFIPKTKALEALIVANNLSLASVSQRVGLKNIQGSANVQSLITGTTANPVVSFRASGMGSAIREGKRLNIGHIVAAADFVNGALRITRLSVNGPEGIATAEGTWDQKSNHLNLDIVGSGVPLSTLAADLQGQAAFLGKVTGTAKAPIAQGRVEVYGAQYQNQQLPLGFADVVASAKKVVASNIEAFRDASRATGQLTLDVPSQAISGTASAEDLRLSEWLGEKVAGTLDVPSVTIAGTLKHISATAKFVGNNIVAEGIKVNTISGDASLDGDQGKLNSVVARLDQGNVTAVGTYNVRTRSGEFAGNATDLSLQALTPQLPKDTTLTGALNASFTARLDENGLSSSETKGNLQDVALNSVLVGSGPFSASSKSDRWTGTLAIGNLERYLEVQNASYDASSKSAHAEFTAYALPIADLYSAGRPYLASDADPDEKNKPAAIVLPATVADELQSLSGVTDAEVVMNGPVQNPDLQISSLEATDLSVGGKASGSISAKGNRTNGTWNIDAFSWVGGPGVVSAQGTIAEHGDTHVSGDINNVNAEWLALFDPALGKLTGQTDVSFSATGPTKSPVIQASLEHSESQASNRRHLELLATIEDGGITARGSYYYNGLTGPVSALIPFKYPFDIPKDQPIDAEIDLPQRTLQDLGSALAWLDPKRTTGSISGHVTVHGLKDNLQLTGQANLSAPVAAVNGIDTTLKDLGAQANFDGSSLTLNASAAGSQGGNISVKAARLDLGNLSDLLGQSVDTLLERSVGGEVTVDNLKVVERGSNPINAVLAGDVALSGPLRTPTVKGSLSAVSGTFSLPSAPNPTSEEFRPTIDPRFNIALSIPNPVAIKAGLGSFELMGAGTLAGTLSLPNLQSQLVVEKGSIRLPNARINIDPGGTVNIFYRANRFGMPAESAEVDITGTTALTANPYGGTIQRYDVTLQVTGDLLANNGLQINAQADPPDLSQDRILMLLGQGGMFSQQNANAEPYRPDQQLQYAVYGALPVLFDPFTQQLATNLGLDYLNIEYNQFEKVAVTAAKSFSKNLVLSARRQLSQPLPGLRTDWDVRLSYRLPLKGRLRNLNLAVGADQDSQWKVSLEYGFRF